MKIKGLDGLSIQEIRDEIDRGAKFVHFTYCVSIIFMTFRRPSDIYFVRSRESAFKYGWSFLTISLFLGWWGIPWGPVYTLGSIFGSFKGKNLTPEVLQELEAQHAENNSITD